MVPLLYACLPNKTKSTYRRMWQAINDLPAFGADNPPKQLLADFEPGAYGAALEVFPAVDLSGCYFHLGQSVDRQVAHLGPRERYLSDRHFRVRVKSLPALAFLPPGDVVEVFDQMQPSFADDEVDLLAYFENTYVGRPSPAGRRPPLFPIALWNVHDRMAHGYTRTNNAVEGMHNSFSNYLLDGARPTVWAFIEGLKRQQSLANIDMGKVAAGGVYKEAGKQVARNQRIATLVQKYMDDGDGIRLCRGIAYNYM